MKQLITTVMLGIIGITSFGQTTMNGKLPVPDRSMTIKERQWVMSNGVLIDNYKFDNKNANQYLNLALNQQRTGRNLEYSGYGSFALGIVMILAGSSTITEDVDNGRGARIFGYMLTVGSSIPVYAGYSRKQKALNNLERFNATIGY